VPYICFARGSAERFMLKSIMKLSRFFFSLILVLAFLQTGLASAQTSIAPKVVATDTIETSQTEFQIAQNLMRQGQYEQAQELAESLQTADGYALAAEALARSVMLGEAKKLKKTSKLARRHAQMALELNPSLQNARLQYVVTDGFIARLTGNVSAWMKKLPQKSFEKIEEYRAEFPQDVRGDALLGAWHLAIVRKAGNKNAQDWFGANVSEGRRLYQKSLNVTPDDPVVLLNYAFALIALDSDDFSDRQEVMMLLTQCASLNPVDDLGRKLINHAMRALELREDLDELQAYAEGFLDGELVI